MVLPLVSTLVLPIQNHPTYWQLISANDWQALLSMLRAGMERVAQPNIGGKQNTE